VRTVINDCAQYDKYADRCRECGEGFYKPIEGEECTPYKTNLTQGYLDVCRELETCESEQWFEGLNAQMNSIYSCHSCRDTDQIPFAVGVLSLDLSTPGLEKFTHAKQFDADFIPYRALQDIDEQSMIQCLEPVRESFNLASTDFAFPENCGLGFVNLESLLEDNNGTWNSHNAAHSSGTTGGVVFDYSKTTVRCAVCKPGYIASREKMTY
jgi:hypothetical protein